MRAHLSHAPAAIESHPLAWSEVPDPIPQGNELLVKVLACGVCRTDLHVVEGDIPRKRNPIIPGHQVVGEVIARGPKCRLPGITIGTRVGIAWLRSTCQECEYCRAGRENLCQKSEYTGYHQHGGFAELALVPEDYAYLLPTDIDPAALTPLLCAGIIGYRALKRSALPAHGSLALYGFGSSAHLAMQIALADGATIYVATREAAHQQLARTLGAAWVGGSVDTPPQKVDSAIIFAPAGEIVPAALRALKPGGTVALAGIHMSEIPSMEYEPHLFHEKQLVSVEANTREDGRELFAVARRIGLSPTITTFPLREANKALQLLKHDGFRGSGVLVNY